jgi:hypothetical protein
LTQSPSRTLSAYPSTLSLEIRGWVPAAFFTIAALSAFGAFFALSASSYWIDELFSLFVADHTGGFGEVLRRALTDTHPPGYYFLLHAWIGAAGSSETATRSLSALLTVAILPVLFFGLRRELSLTARSFTLALGAVSNSFTLAAGNTRNYALAMLLSAGLLVLGLQIARRLRDEDRVAWGLWLALWATGLAAEYVHFYSFLIVGMVHFYLLLSARTWRARVPVLISGMTLACLMSVYVAALLGDSRQDLQHMWFSNNWSDLGRQGWIGVTQAWSGTGLMAVAILVLSPWIVWLRLGSAAAAPAGVPSAAAALSGLVIAGVVAAGLLVSFVIAPSFGARNLLVLAPCFWIIGGWLYDAADRALAGPARRLLTASLVLLIATAALPLRSHALPQNEEWRASAAVVAAAEPQCRGQTIPVVLPYIFGPSTPFFRKLAETRFFGRYYPHPERLRAYAPNEFAAGRADPQLSQLLWARARAGCPVLAWGVHDLDSYSVLKLQRDIAESAGVPSDRVRVREVANRKLGMFGDSHAKAQAFVFERAEPPAAL